MLLQLTRIPRPATPECKKSICTFSMVPMRLSVQQSLRLGDKEHVSQLLLDCCSLLAVAACTFRFTAAKSKSMAPKEIIRYVSAHNKSATKDSIVLGKHWHMLSY